jgi:uncharacterized protein (DUF488 family)
VRANNSETELFTIGHSTREVAEFVDLLKLRGVEVVADVRSSPYSRFTPQFNREALQEYLKRSRIGYVFLGRELGGRAGDPSCYENNKVVYSRVSQTKAFCEGIDRVVSGSASHRIALMCSEQDPLACHRTILVAAELVRRGIQVAHILEDGTLESHADTMDRLLAQLRLPREDLFRSREELVDDALERQGKRIAFVEPVSE